MTACCVFIPPGKRPGGNFFGPANVNFAVSKMLRLQQTVLARRYYALFLSADRRRKRPIRSFRGLRYFYRDWQETHGMFRRMLFFPKLILLSFFFSHRQTDWNRPQSTRTIISTRFLFARRPRTFLCEHKNSKSKDIRHTVTILRYWGHKIV